MRVRQPNTPANPPWDECVAPAGYAKWLIDNDFA
jgi:hypothetical protein